MLSPPIIEATPAGPSRLRVVFADGEVRLFDLRQYTASAYFAPLADAAYLRQVRVCGGTVTWPDGQDFDRGTIYTLGAPDTGERAPEGAVHRQEA